MARAFEEIDAALAAGEGWASSRGRPHPRRNSRFRPGVERVLARRRCRWCQWPCAACGVRCSAGALFPLGRARSPWRFQAHIGLAIGEAVPHEASAAALEAKVSRGDAA